MANAARAARRHGPRARKDVIIGYCRGDMVDGFFHDAVCAILLHDGENNQRIKDTLGFETGPRIARARCEVVKKFLTTEAEWLCWLDTDMVPPHDFVDRLLEHADPDEHPIVGGLCFAGGRTKIVPTIYLIGHNEEGKLESDTQLSYVPNALIEVGGTGGACLIVHRSVYEKILENTEEGHPLPWYQDCIVEGKDWGEDLIFCLRARAAGARIWIHTGIHVGHRKKWTIDERAFLRYAQDLDALVAGPMQFDGDDMPEVEIDGQLEGIEAPSESWIAAQTDPANLTLAALRG